MTTRKQAGRKPRNSPVIQYASLADWRAHFLPDSQAADAANSRREDPEQLAARLVRETLASLRPKTGI
jgi:hypothetical protein